MLEVTKITPIVSVIMPVYNSAKFLRAAIESILNQTLVDFEFIIINDGSTDESQATIQVFNDSRIQLVHNVSNIGVTASLNKAIELCRGRYIARMDADDISAPDRLRKQVAFLESNPDVCALACVAEMMDVNGNHLGWWKTDKENISEAQIKKMLAKTNCIAHPSLMIRSEVIKRYRYRTEKNAAEDYDLWLRLLLHGNRITKLDEPLLRYRIHQQSTTASAKFTTSHNLRVFRQKKVFLQYAISKLRLNVFFFAVLYSTLRSYAAYLKEVFPEILRGLNRIFTTSPFLVSSQLKQLKKVLCSNKARHVFFFPYTHMGGAERVHADIVQAFSQEICMVVFTGFSKDVSFIHRFNHPNTIVLNIPQCLHHPFTKRQARIAFQTFLKENSKLRTLGSNSAYYFELLPHMQSDAVCVDVIHAFKFQPEANLSHLKYINFALRLNHRVFISQNSKTEFKAFLKHHLYGPEVLERLVFIANATDVPKFFLSKPQTFTVIFVGRDSAEKRFHLFERIALKVKKLDTTISFQTAGIPRASNNIILHHGVLSENALSSLYQQATLLVLCSSREGFPLVVMEAMANGVVPICTSVGDIPNHLDANNGVLINTTDEQNIIDEMCAAILNLRVESGLLQELSKNAHAYALKHFSRNEFESTYRQLLA